jgi:hypothetical protein
MLTGSSGASSEITERAKGRGGEKGKGKGHQRTENKGQKLAQRKKVEAYVALKYYTKCADITFCSDSESGFWQIFLCTRGPYIGPCQDPGPGSWQSLQHTNAFLNVCCVKKMLSKMLQRSWLRILAKFLM